MVDRNDVNVSPFNFLENLREAMSLPTSVIIHDTTLREGEQAPGVYLNPSRKLEIARKLDQVGVQQIESGFPAASKDEREAVSAIAKDGLNAKIFGFARAVKGDIDAVIDCDTYGIVLSFPPSDIHLKYKLNMTREQYLERAVECVSYAKAHGLFVSYSAEDSTRTDLNFLKKVFRTVAEAGVDRLRVVDTLGAITPTAMKYLISEVKKEVPRKPVEVHCHNDHGLAVANSLSAVEAGASVISSSVNGLGERCGLAATEQVIIGLHNLYGYNLWKLEEIYSLCKLVESLTGVPIQPSAPVVGEDAFSHKAGIHQHGILQSVSTYEPYPPEMVGRKRTIILGKLSGHHAVKMKLQQIGVNASDDVIFKILDRVKSLSEEKNRSITEEEFQKIVREVMKS